MSKKDKKKKTQAREPWEQSIYETDMESGRSRLEKRQQKKGDTVFLTVLVILLLLIIAFPAATIWFLSQNKTNEKNAKDQPASSIVQSSTQESSAVQSSSNIQKESSSSTEAGIQSESSEDVTQNQNAEPEFTTVLAGEGFQQVAERTGVTIEQLEELNSMSRYTTIQPDQQLRIR